VFAVVLLKARAALDHSCLVVEKSRDLQTPDVDSLHGGSRLDLMSRAIQAFQPLR
jgi:hypothetical protein